MTTKNFKARIGIEAPLIAADNGTTAITLSDNDVTVVGDLTITSNTIKSSTGATAISLSSDDVTVADRLFVTGNIIGGSGGNSTITLSGNDIIVAGDIMVSGNEIKSSTAAVALTLSGTDVTVAGNLEVDGNIIKASDGTTALTLSATTGNVTVAGDLFVAGNEIFSSGGNRNLTFSGTNVAIEGDLNVGGNDIKASDGTTAITLSASTGNVAVAGTLDVQGGTVTDSTGALTISTGASNGSITLDPNGTGNVVMTFANGGNLTNDRNYVAGAIRDATTAAAGDMWSFSSGAGTGYRGLSVDNSAGTTKAPGNVIRGFTGGAVAANGTTPTLTFERARGTSASPTAVQSADFLGRIVATGANGAGTFLGDTVAASPATLQFDAAENFVSNTNVGTTMVLRLMPTGKTLASVATPTVVFQTNPQATTSRSDAFTWQTGNTTALPGSTTTLTLSSTGQLVATGTVSATGATTFGTAVALDATSNLTTASSASGTQVGIQTNYRASSGATLIVPQTNYALGNFRFNSYSDTAGTFVLGASVLAKATENFTATANGSAIVFTANKIGKAWNDTSFNSVVINASPDTTTFSSDLFTFQDSASSAANYATINANTAKFSVPVTTELTTTTISEGTTYTPAATVDNNISVQIDTLSGGTTVIDLINLTGNSRGASYNILLFNNTASGTPIQVKNTRINSNNLTTHTITTGNPRIIINAYVVGDYATATHLVVA